MATAMEELATPHTSQSGGACDLPLGGDALQTSTAADAAACVSPVHLHFRLLAADFRPTVAAARGLSALWVPGRPASPVCASARPAASGRDGGPRLLRLPPSAAGATCFLHPRHPPPPRRRCRHCLPRPAVPAGAHGRCRRGRARGGGAAQAPVPRHASRGRGGECSPPPHGGNPPPPRPTPAGGLNAPPDASAVRTESQRRRNAPVKPLGRRRRRGGGGTAAANAAGEGGGPEIDWEALESVPLVGAGAGREASKSGKNYWVDVADAAKADARRAEARRTAEARASGASGVDEELKEKLKKEVVSPYANNWIGIAVLAVLGLVLAAQLLGTESPVIQIPDL